MKIILKITAILSLLLYEVMICSAQGMEQKKNILLINPMHLSKGNITISLEHFMSMKRSFTVTLSGGETDNYVAVECGINYYPAKPAQINYKVGISVLGYESPIRTGVPVSKPVNDFFESDEDEYYLGLQLANGGLFRVSKSIWFEIDGKIGPSENLSKGKWLMVWSINLNLGINF
ncbi:MAG: hypothetical protein JJE25_09330 [Bacteroidia bacterium]|nr:hypothetical protein [Bacteroidia bacterium]